MLKNKNIIGRKYEIGELSRWYSSGHSEFIAVYGRCRVGKTYLLHELLKDSFSFYHTGGSPVGLSRKHLMSLQLSRFAESLRSHAFENLCFNHIPQIKNALGIRAVNTEVSTWSAKSDNGGAQIDMLISRADNVTNLCEMKFASKPFEIDRDYDEKLQNKIEVFCRETGTKSAILLTFITPFGVAPNQHSGNVQNEVLME